MPALRVVLMLLAVVLATRAEAHKLAPSLLELSEADAAGEFLVSWKTPRFASTPVTIVPRLPEACTEIAEREATYEGTGVRIAWRVSCSESLAGQTLRVDGLSENQSAALVRIAWRDGAVAQGLMNGGKPEYTVPAKQGRLQVSIDYTRLGIGHILGGVDHLLFVLGLLLLVDGIRRLVWTITAFTLGHSVTLAMATLGFLRYPVELVEFAIALSIFVVAVELTREHTDRHFLRRRPWLVAAGFGLLHGMGFAGALREVGLPAHEIPLALLTFNVGIELGQLAFIAVAVAGAWLWRRAPVPARATLEWVPVYLIGVLSIYWCLERGMAALGTS